ncbi:tyrosine-protein phosphatase non-receptor type 5-like [Phymastichus coffea]|uniref:tyrosine-protein phosphatase non-receptor type 5-like n=1 Tax=Phymastichus coffea TaxID=108790 RepID=UPI00273B85D7|nr:tyrosine-protein phosphatase non-receptor type 5-like [Phymastichus coffea]XP_058800823.1 tyrosine-protein phosphatase non-receptor type 5-like [Phymastichus coffea]XP_058800824.1 tyrosine-protein phosphatase non-receptor type 5-like [Phymastichus coffea]
MSASSSQVHKLWRSTTGLDDAGMDLRALQRPAQYHTAYTSPQLQQQQQQLDSNVSNRVASINGQQLPVLVALFAIAAAILFAFLILLWLRQQMSREKDVEEGDRRGLVEEGSVCPPSDDINKISKAKSLTEAKWVSETAPAISVVASEATTSDSITTVKFEKVKIRSETQRKAQEEALPSRAQSETTTTVTSAKSHTETRIKIPHAETSNNQSSTKLQTETRWVPSPIPHASTSCVAMSATSSILEKRSPRRDGNRRTQSMYSQHVWALATPQRTPPHKKSLLERRGSSASLTIDLAPACEVLQHPVTPTRECAEEFLLSARNVLSRAQLRKVVDNPVTLHKEFWEVPQNFPEKTDVCGSGVKNRYKSVLPNPRSRVRLPGSDDPLTSYINANYVRGYEDDARYIATQGPLTHTIQDFWSMAWAERAPVIVMITRLHEEAKTKCEAYFPLELNSRLQIGPFTIIVNAMDTRGGYTVRDLEMRFQNERRVIQHYWYDSWPDHAVPLAADALVGLAAEINTLPGPIIVHCSAGIGRTGCFIALANGMTQLVREGSVDILGILCQMRYDRGGMVQTAEQYEFVHRALCLFEETLDRRWSKDESSRKNKSK